MKDVRLSCLLTQLVMELVLAFLIDDVFLHTEVSYHNYYYLTVMIPPCRHYVANSPD